MDEKAEILENRAQIRMNRSKLDALISILSREGILDPEDLEDEFNTLIKKKDDHYE